MGIMHRIYGIGFPDVILSPVINFITCNLITSPVINFMFNIGNYIIMYYILILRFWQNNYHPMYNLK